MIKYRDHPAIRYPTIQLLGSATPRRYPGMTTLISTTVEL